MTLTSVPLFLVHNGICGSYQCAPGDSEWGTLVWWLEATGDEYAQFLHSCRCLSMCRCRPPPPPFFFFFRLLLSLDRERAALQVAHARQKMQEVITKSAP